MAERPIMTPLPADLPEDWRERDIVAPNGDTIGREPQYGYNYQSQQINETQLAVNAIDEAFETLVDEAGLEAHDTGDRAHQNRFGSVEARLLELEVQLQQHEGRIVRLEDALFNNVTGNPFQIGFESLDAVTVSGVWNRDRQRIEC